MAWMQDTNGKRGFSGLRIEGRSVKIISTSYFGSFSEAAAGWVTLSEAIYGEVLIEALSSGFGIYQSVETGAKGHACHGGRLSQSQFGSGPRFLGCVCKDQTNRKCHVEFSGVLQPRMAAIIASVH